ncbi:MAG: RNA polymerase sigma factor [Chloroflexota bacterium]|nr:RNA polymerase sigma factor [Chloroflexota bacterium]
MLEPAGALDVIEAPEVTDTTGARAAFDARFALARERLLRITASLVGADDAEDVVQDTYLLGRRRFDQLRDESAFEPWLTRIAVNLCFGRHRRLKRLRELFPALLPGKSAASDIGLRDMVEKLPPRERTVLVLHYGHGYGLEEIATLLDLTHTNVRTIIARTRKRLFAAWRHAEGQDR